MDSYSQVLLGMICVQFIIFALSFYSSVFYRCGEPVGSKALKIIKKVWVTMNLCTFAIALIALLTVPVPRDFDFTLSLNLVSEILTLGLSGAIIVSSLFNFILSALGLD